MSPRLRAALLATVVIGGAARVAFAGNCDSLLTVELTPDVPDPRDTGFLSSLLSNQVDYRLSFRGEIDDSNIVVELTGPGPTYRCQDVIQTIGRDGRVLSVGTADISATIAAQAAREPAAHIRLSRDGLGSLYWASQHPTQAWRILLPVTPDEGPIA